MDGEGIRAVKESPEIRRKVLVPQSRTRSLVPFAVMGGGGGRVRTEPAFGGQT